MTTDAIPCRPIRSSGPTRSQYRFRPEATTGGLGDRSFHTVCWYQREFELAPGEGCVLLHFGAVDYFARVWVNGQLVAEHEGGHTPFFADITRRIKCDWPANGDGARSKTIRTIWPSRAASRTGCCDPHSIWYPRTTGIWQTVWLERVATTYIQRLRWTPVFDGFEIGCEIFAAGDIQENLMVEVKIWHGEQLAGRRLLQAAWP